MEREEKMLDSHVHVYLGVKMVVMENDNVNKLVHVRDVQD